MSAYTSALSSFSWNAVVVQAVGSMSISTSRPPLEITQVGSANSHFLTGVATTAINLDIYYNEAQHSAFTSDYLNANQVAFLFETNTGDTFSGEGFIVGIDVVAVNSDVVRGSITIQVTGILAMNGVNAISGNNEP